MAKLAKYGKRARVSYLELIDLRLAYRHGRKASFDRIVTKQLTLFSADYNIVLSNEHLFELETFAYTLSVSTLGLDSNLRTSLI